MSSKPSTDQPPHALARTYRKDLLRQGVQADDEVVAPALCRTVPASHARHLHLFLQAEIRYPNSLNGILRALTSVNAMKIQNHYGNCMAIVTA